MDKVTDGQSPVYVPRPSACNAGNAGEAVETVIETQDAFNFSVLHDGEMERISSRQPFGSEDNLLRTLSVTPFDRKYFVDDAENRVERRLNRIAPMDRNVTMDNFLQHLGVRDKALSSDNQSLE